MIATQSSKASKDRGRWRLRRTRGVLVAVLATLVLGGCNPNASSEKVTDYRQYVQRIEKLGGRVHAHLEFGGSSITDNDLAELDLPDSVRSISLRDTSITDRGVAELKRAEQLECAELTSTQITDAAMNELQQLARLREANVASPNVSGEAFRQIREHVGRHAVELKNQSPIKALPRLPEVKTPPPWEK